MNSAKRCEKKPDKGRKAFARVTKRVAQRGSETILPPGVSRQNAFQHFAITLDDQIVSRAYIDFVENPEGIDGNELVAKVRRDHRIILAPGQGPLKGKVFRIGHLGNYDRFDIIRCLAALELTLEEMGYPVKRGSGVAAAEQVFAQRSPRATLAE